MSEYQRSKKLGQAHQHLLDAAKLITEVADEEYRLYQHLGESMQTRDRKKFVRLVHSRSLKAMAAQLRKMKAS